MDKTEIIGYLKHVDLINDVIFGITDIDFGVKIPVQEGFGGFSGDILASRGKVRITIEPLSDKTKPKGRL